VHAFMGGCSLPLFGAAVPVQRFCAYVGANQWGRVSDDATLARL